MGSLEVDVVVATDDDGGGQNSVNTTTTTNNNNSNCDSSQNDSVDGQQNDNADGPVVMFNGEELCYALPKTRQQFARVKFIMTSCSRFYDFVAMFLPMLEHHRDFGRKSRVFMMRQRIVDLYRDLSLAEEKIGHIREKFLQLREMELKSILGEWTAIRSVLEIEYAEIRLVKFPERYPSSIKPQEKQQWLMEYAIPSITRVKRRPANRNNSRIQDLAEKSLLACRLSVKCIHLSQRGDRRNKRHYTRMALGALEVLDTVWNRLNQASGQPAVPVDGRTHRFRVGIGRGGRLITRRSGRQSRAGMLQDRSDIERALAGEDVPSRESEEEEDSFAVDAPTSEGDESSSVVEEVGLSDDDSDSDTAADPAELDLTTEEYSQGSDDGDSSLEVLLTVDDGDTFAAEEIPAGEEDAPIAEENVSVVEVALVAREGAWAVEEHNQNGGQGDASVEEVVAVGEDGPPVLEEKTPGDAKKPEVLQVTDGGSLAAENGFPTFEGTPAGNENAQLLLLVADEETWLVRAAEHGDTQIEKVVAPAENGLPADGTEKAELHLVAKEGLQIAENVDHQGEKMDAVDIKNGPSTAEGAPVPKDGKKAEIVPEDGAQAADAVKQGHAQIEEVVSAPKNGPPSVEGVPGAEDLVAEEGVEIVENGDHQGEKMDAIAIKNGSPAVDSPPVLEDKAQDGKKAEMAPEEGALAADVVKEGQAEVEEVVSAPKNGPPSVEGAEDLVAEERVQIATNGGAQAEEVVAAAKRGPPSFESAPVLKEGALRAKKAGASMAGVKRPSEPPEPPVVPSKRSRLDSN